MDQSRWFSSASVQRGALRRHRSNAAARFLTEYRDHVGWCCRIARRRRAGLRGPRRPSERHPTPQSTGKFSPWACQPSVPSYALATSPAAPLWFPYPGFQSVATPKMGFTHSTTFIVVPAALMPLCTPSCPLEPPPSFDSPPACLSTEISSSWPRKSDWDSPGTMNLITVGRRHVLEERRCRRSCGDQLDEFPRPSRGSFQTRTKRWLATGSRARYQAAQLSYALICEAVR